MDQRAGQKRATDYLYPPIEPFDRRMIAVSGGHEIYVEQCGAPDGVPVIVFHGGPGGGCSPTMRRFFDPRVYRVILFDQRGCGRSRPLADTQDNTTWDLVADAELIRTSLGLGKVIAFGGSWGATLALVYAISYPEHVAHLVLRGVFLMTKAELDWFYGGGVAGFFPDLWQRVTQALPEAEQNDIITAYHRRLFCGEYNVELRFARLWSQWENALASLGNEGLYGESPAAYARAFARLESHYFINGGFLPYDDWIMKNRSVIEHIGVTVIQGRYDMVCPPISAWRLVQNWPGARLEMIGMAGHALSETGISAALVRVMDRLQG